MKYPKFPPPPTLTDKNHLVESQEDRLAKIRDGKYATLKVTVRPLNKGMSILQIFSPTQELWFDNQDTPKNNALLMLQKAAELQEKGYATIIDHRTNYVEELNPHKTTSEMPNRPMTDMEILGLPEDTPARMTIEDLENMGIVYNKNKSRPNEFYIGAIDMTITLTEPYSMDYVFQAIAAKSYAAGVENGQMAKAMEIRKALDLK